MAYIDTQNMNIRPRDLLYALGFGKPRRIRYGFSNTMIPVALFGAGALVGAGVALILAPKSGREFRGDLSRQANQLTERVKERMPALPAGGAKSKQQEWESGVPAT